MQADGARRFRATTLPTWASSPGGRGGGSIHNADLSAAVMMRLR
jgi:hypothetical protein